MPDTTTSCQVPSLSPVPEAPEPLSAEAETSRRFLERCALLQAKLEDLYLKKYGPNFREILLNQGRHTDEIG